MKTPAVLVLLTVVLTVLAGCGPAPAAALPTLVPPTSTPPPPSTELPADTPTSAPPPTQTLAATPEPSATEPPKPTTTPLPEGVLFRDDFDGALQPGWQWQDENPAKWTIRDSWLQIVGENNTLLEGQKQNNLLWYPLPDGDFAITVRLQAKPFENFQQAAIFIYEDPDNYITINRGFCGPCVPNGGGFFMDYKIAGIVGDYKAATDVDDVYLRLESKDDVISGFYATEPDKWTRLGRFGNYFKFKKVGIGVSNVHAVSDVIGKFDYFEISRP